MLRLIPAPGGPVEALDAYADLPPAAGRPGLRLNMVASLDGAIAVEGRSGALGGDADLRVFRTLRSLADVVMVAAGTVRAEMYGPPKLPDDLIAARLARGQPRLPRLAVVSRSLQLDWGSRLFAEADPDARPLVVTCESAPPEGLAHATEVAEVVVAGGEAVDLPSALIELGARGAGSVLCEGGPRLNTALAVAGLLDELCLTVSPRLVGGDARHMLDGPEPAAGGLPMRLHAAYEEDGFLFLRHRSTGSGPEG